jgi:hypothetical protein
MITVGGTWQRGSGIDSEAEMNGGERQSLLEEHEGRSVVGARRLS